jgi:sugar lactone lactonase YvrE
MTSAEQITDAVAEHGEGPVWWPDWGGLRWVDMLAGDVLTLDVSAEVRRTRIGTVAAALRPRRAGGMVVATEHDFVIVDDTEQVVATPVSDPGIRFNDGGCDPDGNFYCGTMRYDEGAGGGTLYRLNADHTVDVVLRDVTVSNGLAWTPDGRRAYYVDTATSRIDVFDHDPVHGLRNRRPFAEIPADRGFPDGLTLDAEGGVWVALWEGGVVHRYSTTGELEEVVELPTPKVTACTFGGADLDELFITTSRHGETDPHPAAGALFRVRPGVRGLPASAFAG